jgi:hypothetical protein
MIEAEAEQYGIESVQEMASMRIAIKGKLSAARIRYDPWASYQSMIELAKQAGILVRISQKCC